MRVRKKPVEVEAVQLSWKTWNELADFIGDNSNIFSHPDYTAYESEGYSDTCGETPPFIEMAIPTLEGTMIARHGDWIIRGVKGEFYPCKPEVFNATYDILDE